MNKLLDKLAAKLGYIPKPERPSFNIDVYTVYKEKILQIQDELEGYKQLARDTHGQLPEQLRLAELRIDALRKENDYLYGRLRDHNLLWNDDSRPYVLPYNDEFFDKLEKETVWKSSTAKKSKKSNKLDS